MAAESKKHDMNMIGSATGQCQTVNINKSDKQILSLMVVADNFGVRNL